VTPLDARRARLVLRAAIVVAALLQPRAETRADDAGSGRRDRVVARIGPTAITVGQLEDRVAELAPFQRASLGATPRAVARRLLAEVVAREELLALGAEDLKLRDQPPAAYRIERARSSATVRALRRRIGPASAVSMQDVRAYYDENRTRYDAPARYQIWRILCKTRDDAQAVLDAARRDPTPATFAALAREHSADKATYLRSGNLGFVTADGASSEPGFRVDRAVVDAAQSVHDGDIVPSPVAEGDYFSVVWRRATVAPVRRSVDEVAAQIRDTIWKARVKQETDKLVAALRAAHLRDLDAALLAAVDLPAGAGDVSSAPPRGD